MFSSDDDYLFYWLFNIFDLFFYFRLSRRVLLTLTEWFLYFLWESEIKILIDSREIVVWPEDVVIALSCYTFFERANWWSSQNDHLISIHRYGRLEIIFDSEIRVNELSAVGIQNKIAYYIWQMKTIFLAD